VVSSKSEPETEQINTMVPTKPAKRNNKTELSRIEEEYQPGPAESS